MPRGQASGNAQLAVGFPAWSSEEGYRPRGGLCVGPLVLEFYPGLLCVHV